MNTACLLRVSGSLLTALIAHSVSAATFYTDRAAWQAAMALPLSVYDFDTFTNTSGGAFTAYDFGDFSATLTNPQGTVNPPTPKLRDQMLKIQQGTAASVLEFDFDQAVQGVGFDYINTDSSSDALEILFGADSHVFGPGNTSGWFGIIFDAPVTRFGISEAVGGGGVLEHGWIDNVEYNAVPVPAAVWLFGAGLLGLLMRKIQHEVPSPDSLRAGSAHR